MTNHDCALQQLEDCVGKMDVEEVKKPIREMEEWELVEATEMVYSCGD